MFTGKRIVLVFFMCVHYSHKSLQIRVFFDKKNPNLSLLPENVEEKSKKSKEMSKKIITMKTKNVTEKGWTQALSTVCKGCFNIFCPFIFLNCFLQLYTEKIPPVFSRGQKKLPGREAFWSPHSATEVPSRSHRDTQGGRWGLPKAFLLHTLLLSRVTFFICLSFPFLSYLPKISFFGEPNCFREPLKTFALL